MEILLEASRQHPPFQDLYSIKKAQFKGEVQKWNRGRSSINIKSQF